MTREIFIARPYLNTSLALLLAFFAGCSNKDAWQAKTQPAKGKVVINGEVPVGLMVILHPINQSIDIRKTEPWGKVGEDGYYHVRTYKPADGAPVGEYQATLVWRFNPEAPEFTDRLNFAYSEPSKSLWKFTIKEGENELPLIELKDVKVSTSPPKKPSGPSPLEVN